MDASKARAKLASKRVSFHEVCEKEHELIRELRDLLRSYGPLWYTKELDTRLCEALAVSISLKDQTKH
jgi:hypothetical protein